MIALAALPLLAFATTAEPTSAAATSQEVRVKVRLGIDATGKADSCEIVETDAPAELAAKVCPIFMSKANFKPALDESGKPKHSTMTTSVKFVLQN